MHSFAVCPRRACAALAAVLTMALAGDAQAQNSRAERLLSDKPAPERRSCRITNTPSALPALSQLADSAQLAAAVAQYAEQFPVRDGKLFGLYSITFDARGDVSRVTPVDYWLPQGEADRFAMIIRTALRPQPAGGFSMRLRVEPGGTPVFRTGWSEVCAPASRMSFSLVAPVASGAQAPRAPVRLKMFINEQGGVADISIVGSSGNGEVDRWVENRVLSYRFSPGLVDGIPTAMEHEQTVRVRGPNGRSGRSRTGS